MRRQLIDIPQIFRNAAPIGSSLKCEHQETDNGLELSIIGVVGDWWDGITSNEIDRLLSRNRGKRVSVKINSPGGWAMEGIAIYNLLADHDGEVVTTVIGDASSAASLILQAGDTRRMKATASFLIHRAWAMVAGNAGQLRSAAASADVVDATIARLYAERGGQDSAYWMDKITGPKDTDGTLYTAEQALEDGLIDEIIESAGSSDSKKVAMNAKAVPSRWASIQIRQRMVDIDARFTHD